MTEDKISTAELQDEALMLLATGDELAAVDMRQKLQSEVFRNRRVVESTFMRAMKLLTDKGVLSTRRVRRRVDAIDGTSHMARMRVYKLIKVAT